MAHKAKNTYCLALYRKSLPTSVAIINQGTQGGRNMCQKEGNELKFGHKGTQIETSVKKLGKKTNCEDRAGVLIWESFSKGDH